MYIGSYQESWSAAADLSAQLNIIYKPRPFKRVLSMPSEMYDEMWTGGKAMYKTEPVIADGGELIIYAPHIKEVSVTHGKLIETLLSEDDWPRQRAGFIDHHLWITPYQPDEQYAAGMYPTLSRPGEGLPAFTAKYRSIEQTDIVAWVTMGMYHVVRAEDWPVMPVAWHYFELRPFDFFDRNPALDLPMKP